ncbi:MAG: DUF1573 domain-containing protein [Flavobacterium sp.]|nr:DUF1573 domain-containing protein [Pedobacter sp.]
MKKLILSLITIVALGACNNASKQAGNVSNNGAINANVSPANSNDSAPVFKFEKESYDFGQIKEGEQVSYEFAFKNTGNTPLIITGATATCGCTVPEFPKEPIAPNGQGKISVTFDSKGKGGMQNKVITVTANTIPSTTQLHLLGDVKTLASN